MSRLRLLISLISLVFTSQVFASNATRQPNHFLDAQRLYLSELRKSERESFADNLSRNLNAEKERRLTRIEQALRDANARSEEFSPIEAKFDQTPNRFATHATYYFRNSKKVCRVELSSHKFDLPNGITHEVDREKEFCGLIYWDGDTEVEGSIFRCFATAHCFSLSK